MIMDFMIQIKILMIKLNQNIINLLIIGMTLNKTNYYNKFKMDFSPKSISSGIPIDSLVV